MLDASTLQTALEDLAAHPGSTVADCATKWADAISAFMAGVVPSSATAVSGKALLATQLAAAFGQPTAAAVATALDAALTAYATVVGGGMAPAFAGVAPVAPVGFAALFAPPFATSHAAAALKVATRLNVWALLGTATPVTGSPVTWT